MALVAHSSESCHLLVNTANEDPSSPLQQKSVCISCPPSKHLCLPSKAAILILLWTIIIGAMYHNFVGFSAYLVMSNPHPTTILSEYEPLPCVPYAILAIVMMFYPLSGFIADVCCGRLKTVSISLISLLFCMILLLLALSVMETDGQGILTIILAILSLLTFVFSLTGYIDIRSTLFNLD